MDTWILQMIRARCIRRVGAWTLTLGCIVGLAIATLGYLAIAAAVVFAFLVRYGLPAAKHLQDLSSHPVVRRVASWGDPIGVAAEVEREARATQYKSAGWLVTNNYLIRSSFFTFDVLRFWDLVWAYKRVTTEWVNFIPMGRS